MGCARCGGSLGTNLLLTIVTKPNKMVFWVEKIHEGGAMRVRTAELDRDQLDWAVAVAIGEVKADGGRVRCPAYSEDGRLGVTLMHRYQIGVGPSLFGWIAAANACVADADMVYPGHTPLVAAMRALVGSELGDEVEIPWAR